MVVGENGVTMKLVRCDEDEEDNLERPFVSDTLGRTVYTLEQALEAE